MNQVSQAKPELQEEKALLAEWECRENKETLDRKDSQGIQVNRASRGCRVCLDQRALRGTLGLQGHWDQKGPAA